MNLEFKEITVEDSPVMLPYYNMRKNNTCDSISLPGGFRNVSELKRLPGRFCGKKR